MAIKDAPESYTWVSAPADKTAVNSLAAAYNCPDWFASLLTSRGISTVQEAEAWMNPRLSDLSDPFLLPGMKAAIDRIMKAVDAGERITIFGDYDVDGLTSSALMKNVLDQTRSPISVFLPHRLDEGYGLSSDALQRCIDETDPHLIITVDCGTGSVEAVQEAQKGGIDVIITDHHSIGDDVAPAVAVVNPRCSDNESLHVLAGVGVAFKCCHALLKKARLLPKPPEWAQFDLRTVLDLVALGTVADLVPLIGENRIFVHSGLKLLNQSQRPGLKALRTVARISKKIGTYEIAFQLAPRLNASGRLGTAQTSLKLLLTHSHNEAVSLAAKLDLANRERQQVEKTIVRKLEQVTEERMESGSFFSIVEADREWHPGVIGIAAARIMQKHFRPAIVIGSDDQGRAKGSCRSIPGFNIVDALSTCRDHLVKFGGHAMAAGIEIEWDNIEAFRAAFEKTAYEALVNRPLIPELRVDAWINSREVDDRTMELLDKLAPFGIGNPEPLWGCRGMALSGQAREVGKGHLKAHFVSQGTEWEAIGFGLFSKTLPRGPIDAAFHLRKDDYLGNCRLVLHLKDFKASKYHN